MLNALFVLKIFHTYSNFCPDFFDPVEKQIDKKAKVDF